MHRRLALTFGLPDPEERGFKLLIAAALLMFAFHTFITALTPASAVRVHAAIRITFLGAAVSYLCGLGRGYVQRYGETALWLRGLSVLVHALAFWSMLWFINDLLADPNQHPLVFLGLAFCGVEIGNRLHRRIRATAHPSLV